MDTVGHNQGDSWMHSFQEAPGTMFSGLSRFWRGAFPGLWLCSSSFQAHPSGRQPSPHPSEGVHLHPAFEDPCDCTAPACTIQDNLPSLRSVDEQPQFLFAMRCVVALESGIRTWNSLGDGGEGHYSVYHCCSKIERKKKHDKYPPQLL